MFKAVGRVEGCLVLVLWQFPVTRIIVNSKLQTHESGTVFMVRHYHALPDIKTLRLEVLCPLLLLSSLAGTVRLTIFEIFLCM